MLGFFAEAKNQDLKVDHDEIEDANWFKFKNLQELSHPNIPNWVTAPTTLYFLPNLVCKVFLAIAPAATLAAVSLAEDLPPPL